MEDRPPALYATVAKKPKLPFGCFLLLLIGFVLLSIVGILYALDRNGALQDVVRKELGKYIPALAPPTKKKPDKPPGPLEQVTRGGSAELKLTAEKIPADTELWAQYGYALEREGKVTEATRAFTLATQYNMIASSGWVELARHYLRVGKKEDVTRAITKAFENADRRDLSKINPRDQYYAIAPYELQFALALLEPAAPPAPAVTPAPATGSTGGTSSALAGLPPVSGSTPAATPAPSPTTAPAASPAATATASPSATAAASPSATAAASPTASATPAAAPEATPSPAAQRYIAAIKARDDSQKDTGGIVRLLWEAGKVEATIPYLEAMVRLEPTSNRPKEILYEALEKAGKTEEAAALKAKMGPATAPVADPRAK
ncbi:MAG: hypothetical protein JSR82_16960 [Verrucomicrobia bacterium]|nr:hypothetical protein [Verrucomicrobiota bacterium]